jgi:phage FluMu gp28-like protein
LVHVVSSRKECSRYRNETIHSNKPCKEGQDDLQEPSIVDVDCEDSTDNKQSFELTNGSQVKAGTTSGDAGRSEALSLLIIDEAAFVDGLEELWTGLYPTLSTGGRCIALSTPNGVGNWFHKTYTESETEMNDFSNKTNVGCPPR